MTCSCSTSRPPSTAPMRMRDFARHDRLDGLIVISLPLSDDEVERLGRDGLPVVLVDVAHPRLPHVVIDDVDGGRLATEHLLAKGHRRIGFIGDLAENPFGFTSSERRRHGYELALRAAGIEPSSTTSSSSARTGSTRPAARRGAPAPRRSADGDLRRLRHAGGRRPPLRPRARTAGPSGPRRDRLRRHRRRGHPGADHGAAAPVGQRRTRRGARCCSRSRTAAAQPVRPLEPLTVVERATT